MFDYTSGTFGIGDYQITIGGGGYSYPPYSTYPPYSNYPVNPQQQQTNQILLIGVLIVAAVLILK